MPDLKQLREEMRAGLELIRHFGWHLDAGDDWDQPRILNNKGQVVAVFENSDAARIRADHVVRCSPENIRALLDLIDEQDRRLAGGPDAVL